MDPSKPFQEAKREALDAALRSYFSALFSSTGGNVSEMARRARMERGQVRAYLRRLGIVAAAA